LINCFSKVAPLLIRSTGFGSGTTITYPCIVSSSAYYPNSQPLFLNFVWPVLRSAHWRLEAGDHPSSVTFLPPGQGSRRKEADKRGKHDRVLSRAKLARATNEVGLGFVPKLTKRVFANAVGMEPVELKSSCEKDGPLTVNHALRKFYDKIVGEMTSGDGDQNNEESVKRLKMIIGHIR